MKYWVVMATTADVAGDVPFHFWTLWNRKSLAEATAAVNNLQDDFNSGNMRRILMVEHEWDGETWKTTILKKQQHPVQKKVIYNQQEVKKAEPVVAKNQPPENIDWAFINNLFNQIA